MLKGVQTFRRSDKTLFGVFFCSLTRIIGLGPISIPPMFNRLNGVFQHSLWLALCTVQHLNSSRNIMSVDLSYATTIISYLLIYSSAV